MTKKETVEIDDINVENNEHLRKLRHTTIFKYCQHNPLLLACLSGSLEHVEKAVNEISGCTTQNFVNQPTTNNFCALHAAVCSGSSKTPCIVKLLLHWGAFVDCQDTDEFTPLMANCIWAPNQEHARAVAEILVKHGANVQCSMCDGRTAVDFAAEARFTDLVAWLSDRNTIHRHKRMRARGLAGFTSLANGRIVLATRRNELSPFHKYF